MDMKPSSTPASSAGKNTPKPTLGQILRSEMNWGAGAKSSGATERLFAGGVGSPSDKEVTPADLERLAELLRMRSNG